MVADPFDLDALERRATRVLWDTYGPMMGKSTNAVDRQSAFWSQKGIEAMRCAVAEAKQALEDD